MSLAVIPAPLRFDPDGGRFGLRAGTRIAYETGDVAPVVERFCSEIARRTGLGVTAVAGREGSEEPSLRVELVHGGELGAVPVPRGVSPTGDPPPDERYSLTLATDTAVVRAVEPTGVARGLTTFLQLATTAPSGRAEGVSLPGGVILDGPRYAWRGLSLDLARRFLAPDEVRRVIDLLGLYKLNVLHLHLTDDQGWRLPQARPGTTGLADDAFYSNEDLRALVAYAADRFVTLVPEVDTPGHASALLQLHPELQTARNGADPELSPGHPRPAAWLDPDLPATFDLIEEVLAGVAAIFPSPYLHIGGDEPRGMPRDLYRAYVRRVRDVVRSMGKRPVAWQESARAGLDPDDVIQYWLSDIDLAASLPPGVQAHRDADLLSSHRDVETALSAGVPVIVSPLRRCYLDVPYAGQSADPSQAARQGRAGLRLYSPMTVEESFDWEPANALGPDAGALVAGVEAAIWSETIADFDDLAFLLLPRLAGVAQRAWSDPRVTDWSGHRARLARHGRLWRQDDLTYFRDAAVNWL
jgi:hexosaminidase